MSGHSKWSSIKHQKGAADAKRSAVFSKMAAGITVAARTGGGTDPAMNFQLRIAVDRARAANMPKDNIERAIERAKGTGANALEEITLEIYGPAGSAFIVQAATDNRNRTLGDLRAVLNRHGGKLAESGSVSYLFKNHGQIVIPVSDNAEEIELALIEAGAENYEEDDGKIFAYTDPKELEHVREALIATGLTIEDFGFEMTPSAVVAITDPDLAKKVLELSEALDEITDVTQVFGNFDIDESVLS